MAGKETREYKCVLEHMGTICNHLKVNKGARESLTIKYEEKGWLALGETPNEKFLVEQVLTRISSDASQYHIFMDMLKEIVGMEIIWKKIKGMLYHIHMCICEYLIFIQIPIKVKKQIHKVENINFVCDMLTSVSPSASMKPQPILEPTLLSKLNSVTFSNTPLSQATSTTASNTALFNETRAQEIAGEAAQLEERFVNVLMHTKICFAEKESESETFLERFKITLTTLPLSKKHQHLHFLKNKKEDIKKARNSEEIFDILEDYWNYSDYDLLEYIIKEFGTKKLKDEMDIYITVLEQFEMKTTIQDYDAASIGEMNIPEHFRTVTIEQGKDPLKCTLYDVRQFENDIVNRAAFNKFAVFKKSVKSSSVEVVLAFPPEAYADLLDIFDEQYKKEHAIVSIVFSERAGELEGNSNSSNVS